MKLIPYLLIPLFLATACDGTKSFDATNNEDSNEKSQSPQTPGTVPTTTVTTTSTSTTIATTTTTLPTGACAPTPQIIPGGTIAINGGVPGTTSLAVNLKLGRDGETGKMKISNNANCECGTWERYNEDKAWTLLTPNSTNTISVQYKNFEGAGSQCVRATMIHDNLGPAIQLALNPSNSYWAGDATGLQINVVDAGIGVQSVSCKLNGAVTACSAGASDLLFQRQKVGLYIFEIFSVDQLGNFSSANIQWEMKERPTIAPEIKLALAPGNSYWGGSDTQLKLEVLDSGDGVRNLVCKLNGLLSPCVVGLNNLVFTRQFVGNYVFEVSATNDAGKPASNTISWEMKLKPDVAPEINLALDANNTYLSGDDTRLKLVVLDKGDGIQNLSCRLNGVASSCTAGINNLIFTKQAVGAYVFDVAATNNNGKPASATIAWSVRQKVLDISQNIEIKSNNKVDILIVDDNSASMEFEQRNMAARMSTFLNQLQGLDWRIAITTTGPTSKIWGDGRLVTMKGLTNQYMITSSTPAQQAQKVLGDTVQRSETGSSVEQGIFATYRAVERSLATAASPNKDFFRNDANFATIVISDEDESAKGFKNIPENLVSFLKTTWSSKLFSFHSIITRPNDVKCATTQGATYGVTYEKLSKLTGAGTIGGSIIGSVCEVDYGSQLRGIGDSVQEMQRIMNLQCAPVGAINSAVVITLNGSNFTAPYEVQGLKLVFNTNLPKGQYVLQYKCNL